MCFGTFREFKVVFDAAKVRVEDRTEVEEREVLMAALTENQRFAVAKEEAARNRHKFFIKFVGLENMSVKEIAEQFPMLEPMAGRTLGEVVRTPKGFIIGCKSLEVQQILLQLHGEEIEGDCMRVYAFDKKK